MTTDSPKVVQTPNKETVISVYGARYLEVNGQFLPAEQIPGFVKETTHLAQRIDITQSVLDYLAKKSQ